MSNIFKSKEENIKGLEIKVIALQKELKSSKDQKKCLSCITKDGEIDELTKDLKAALDSQSVNISFVKKDQSPKKGCKFVTDESNKLIEVKINDKKYA